MVCNWKFPFSNDINCFSVNTEDFLQNTRDYIVWHLMP